MTSAASRYTVAQSCNGSKGHLKLNGIPLCNKKEQTTDTHNVDESQKFCIQQNKLDTKE